MVITDMVITDMVITGITDMVIVIGRSTGSASREYSPKDRGFGGAEW